MTEPLRVLLVEDNPGDADLTRAGLEKSQFPIELTVLASGTEAVQFIHRKGKFAEEPRPDFVLLDLNLPGVDGQQVLSEIKRNDEMRRIPVSILTSSSAESDVMRSYELGANSYVVKPFDFKNHQNIVRSVEEFWFRVAKLPRRGAAFSTHI